MKLTASVNFWLFLCCSLLSQFQVRAQKKILLFGSYEQTYYSEFIVMKEALEASGYQVDVRSGGTDYMTSYMVPAGTTIDATADTHPGSSYAAFQTQFQELFGTAWDATLNATPATLASGGSILDVPDLTGYEALVIAGGTGALDYRVDGTYTAQGSGGHQLSAQEVEQVALHLNALALNALENGKPVLAQCHGASLPVFWRIPNTAGAGTESLGISLLKNQSATGYPDTQTATDYTSIFVSKAEPDPVRISSPNSAFSGAASGRSRIITSRDWYPQTVAHAAKTLLNLLESYPSDNQLAKPTNVLIIHGGAVDPNNCNAANRLNDVPCNYGAGPNLPADFTTLKTLFESDSPLDPFTFTVADINLTGSLPFDANNQADALAYFSQFHSIVFFKHWATGITDALQLALVDFADQGGGILTLHHGLYHDIDGSLNKNILVNTLFRAESAMNTWSANLTTYPVYSTNHGHFISHYGLDYPNVLQAANLWGSNPLLTGSNQSASYYPSFMVYDEIYNNMQFLPGTTFGTAVNDITPLFSNDQSPGNQVHTTGFMRQFDDDLNGTIGRLVYFEIGERTENLLVGGHYAQVVRNAAIWSANLPADPVASVNEKGLSKLLAHPNPVSAKGVVHLKSADATTRIVLTDTYGQPVFEGNYPESGIDLGELNLAPGSYVLHANDQDQLTIFRLILY